MLGLPDVRATPFDGDTPFEERQSRPLGLCIRVILTQRRPLHRLASSFREFNSTAVVVDVMVGAAAGTIVARADATAVEEAAVDLRLLRPRPARVCEGLRTEPPSGRTPQRSLFPN